MTKAVKRRTHKKGLPIKCLMPSKKQESGQCWAARNEDQKVEDGKIDCKRLTEDVVKYMYLYAIQQYQA